MDWINSGYLCLLTTFLLLSETCECDKKAKPEEVLGDEILFVAVLPRILYTVFGFKAVSC